MTDPDFSLPRALSCGVFESTARTERSKWRTTSQYEIELFLDDGGNRYHGESTACPIRQGTVHVARPGERLCSELPFRALFLKFSADGSLAAALDALPPAFLPRRAQDVRDRFLDLTAACLPGAPGDARFFAKVFALLDLLFSDAGRGSGPVAEAAAYIERHAAEGPSLSRVAEAVHMSPSYLHDCFKQAYGVTPHDYLIRVRLTEARRLLSDGRLTLAAVAAKTGFASQQYFTKLFKAETGVTPGAYRRHLRDAYRL